MLLFFVFFSSRLSGSQHYISHNFQTCAFRFFGAVQKLNTGQLK